MNVNAQQNLTNNIILKYTANPNLLKIAFDYCDTTDILALAQVSKSFNNLINIQLDYKFEESIDKYYFSNTNDENCLYNSNFFPGFFNTNNNKNKTYGIESPNNYTWKNLFSTMNKIKNLWCIPRFKNCILNLDFQNLHQTIYENLKNCSKPPDFREKNKILENNVNSLFQTTLFGFLYEEQEIIDYYEKLFNNKIYKPRNENSLFKEFIINYKNLFYKIQKNGKYKKSLKKLRWYLILNKDNYTSLTNTEKNIKEKNFDLRQSSFLFEYHEQVENENDSLDEEETKEFYNEFISNKNKNLIDTIEQTPETNIINDEVIEKLLNKEDVAFFYVIKLIYLSICTYCKAAISHLINLYDKKELIIEYNKKFENFILASKEINKLCENINITMNFLYKDLFNNYPNFPKFSIFRLCLKCWFNEMNTFLIGNNTLLFIIKNNVIEIFYSFLDNEIKDNISFKISNSYNHNIKKNFGLGASISLLNPESYLYQSNNINNIYSSFMSFDLDNDDIHILEKGLSIIVDTFLNEYSVNLINFSEIDVNNIYLEVENIICDMIVNSIEDIYQQLIIKKNNNIKDLIIKIVNYYESKPFYNENIIAKSKKKIFDSIYHKLKDILLDYINNKFLNYQSKEQRCNVNNRTESNISLYSDVSISTNQSLNINLKSSFCFDFSENNNNNFINKTNNDYETEIISYILKNGNYNFNYIKKIVTEINNKEKIYELLSLVDERYKNLISEIERNDIRIKKELNKKNITYSFNEYQRKLLSFSMNYDWSFIKKSNALHKMFNSNMEIEMKEDDEDVIMRDNTNFHNNNDLKGSVFGFDFDS